MSGGEREGKSYGNGLYGENNPIDFDSYLSEENIGTTRVLLKTDFTFFIMFFYRYIYRDNFRFMPFHDEIIKSLEEYVYGEPEKKNLGICLPPRWGKSIIMVFWIPWCFAINARCNFIYTCYEERITNKMSDDMLNIIRSPFYKLLFGVELSGSTEAKALWETKEKGSYRASPLGGAMTGFGAGLVGKEFGGAFIIDDPLNAKFFNSIAEKRKVTDIYQSVVKKRLNNSAKTPIVTIMQRLATDDLIGYIKENEGEDWRFIEVPALDEGVTPAKSNWEWKSPTQVLLKEKAQSPYVFAAQMQQKPIVLGGELCKEEWFKYYNKSQQWAYRKCYMVADTAFKNTEYADYTAIGLFGITMGKELHLIDMLHKKINAVDLQKEVLQFWNKWKGGVCGRRVNGLHIEDRASGMQLIQDLKRVGGIAIIPFKDKGFDKLTKWNELLPNIAAGNVYLPNGRTDPISNEVVNEMIQLCGDMSHAHDDIADMLYMGNDVAFGRKGVF